MEIGVGIIGCGIRGRHGYEQYLATHPYARLRALAHYPDSSAGLREGRTPEQDEAYARELGVPFYGEDYRRVLERRDIQIVSLMVEPGQVAGYVEQAAAAGKHLVLDKPLAGSVADGRRIVEAVERYRVKLLVALNERTAPPFAQARERIASGSMGALLTATCNFVFGGPLAGFTGNTAYRESFGGGEWANFGCYCADYVNWLAGARPVSVFGQVGSFFYDDYREAGLDDLGQAVVRYENGVIGTLMAGRPRAAFSSPQVFADLTAENGTVRVNCNVALLEIARAESHRAVPYGSTGLRELCRSFVDAVIDDLPSPIPAEAELAALEVVHAAYESARTGNVVRL